MQTWTFRSVVLKSARLKDTVENPGHFLGFDGLYFFSVPRKFKNLVLLNGKSIGFTIVYDLSESNLISFNKSTETVVIIFFDQGDQLGVY